MTTTVTIDYEKLAELIRRSDALTRAEANLRMKVLDRLDLKERLENAERELAAAKQEIRNANRDEHRYADMKAQAEALSAELTKLRESIDPEKLAAAVVDALLKSTITGTKRAEYFSLCRSPNHEYGRLGEERAVQLATDAIRSHMEGTP